MAARAGPHDLVPVLRAPPGDLQLAADRPAGSCCACGEPPVARRLQHVLRPEVTRSELIRLKPGGTVEVPFRLELGGTVPTHQYDLRVAFVSLTRIQLGHRCFWVTD